MKNRIGIPFERIYSSIERGTRECGPGGALMVHVGECRERNHTGKDDSEGGEGDRGEKRDGTTPGSSRLSRNRKLDRGMWISSRSRPLDSRNRCQSLRIADRAPPFLILLLITSGVPRSRLPFPGDITHLLEQVGLFYSRPAGETPPAERRRDEPLPSRGSGGKGNEIPRNHHPSRIPDQVGRKCSKGANSSSRFHQQRH